MQFVKLHDRNFGIDLEHYPIGALAKIIWFLIECIRDVDREAAAIAAA